MTKPNVHLRSTLKRDVKVVSGAFEGIYAWISLNFLKGRFAPGNSGSTFGILEIGGASHQNTFENPSKETIDLTVAGKPYHVISKRCISLLGVI